MSNKKKYKKQTQPPSAKGSAAKPAQQMKSLAPEKPSNLRLILLVGVVIITFLCYKYTLNNSFTNWDDGLYVETNPYIKNLTKDNMNMILFHNITNNYYHPITMLSIAANYHFSKMDPHGYYLTNVLIHVANTCIMFMLVYLLLQAMEEKGYGRMKGKEWLAALGALCYGVHPMHVESVSWLAERKDVLYGFFYFLGLIVYLKYLKEDKIKWMALVVLMYLCSLASKPLAVVFPFSLFALDVLLKREIKQKLFIEKLPFFLISLAGGIWAWHAQKASGAVASFGAFSIYRRFVFAAYGFTMYIVKAFAPFHLCSYYPYPQTDEASNLSIYYNILPFVAPLIPVIPLYAAYKAGENYLRVVIFGIAFYLFNVVFVLQFVSSGPAIMADRYTYIAYFGIFFMVVYFVQQIWEKLPTYCVPLQVVMTGFVVMLAYVCYGRTFVWHNTETLWKDVIAKYPASADSTWDASHTKCVVTVHEGVETAYKNLGNYFVQDKKPPDYDSAYLYYEVLERTNTKDAGVYSNLGNIWAIRHNFKKSLEEYAKSLQLDSNNFDVHLDMAITYASMGEYQKAMTGFNRAYRMDPNSENLLLNRASTYLNMTEYQAAMDDYNHLLRINPDNIYAYAGRGLTRVKMNDSRGAVQDLSIALRALPNDGACLYNMASAYTQLKEYPTALDYATKAKKAGYPVPDDFIHNLQNATNNPGK